MFYITTGARLPEGCNAVIKVNYFENTDEQLLILILQVEDTENVNGNELEKQVNLKVFVNAGSNVRQIGSDMR